MSAKPILLIKVKYQVPNKITGYLTNNEIVRMLLNAMYPSPFPFQDIEEFRSSSESIQWDTLKNDYNILVTGTLMGKDLYQFEVLNPSGEYDFEALKEIVMKAIEETK
jgi:hypothetical protein